MPDGARRAAAPRLLGVALAALLVLGCGTGPRHHVDQVVQGLRELPGVGSVEGSASAGDATVRLALTARAEPAHAERVVREAADRLAPVTGPDGETSVRVTHPDRPEARAAREFVASARSVPDGAVAAGSMAADARVWFALADAYPRAYVTVYQEHIRHSEYIRSVVVSLAPGAPPAAVSETFRAMAARPFAPADAESTTVDVPPLQEVPGHGHIPSFSYSAANTLGEPGLRAFEALAAAQPAGPGAAAAVRVSATEAGARGPHLDVEVDLPAHLVTERVPGSAAEAVAAAYWQVLETSGLPYELAVAALDHPPFLEVAG